MKGSIPSGYAISSDSEIGPDGKKPEREAYADVVFNKRLATAIEKLNPTIPTEARGDALRKLLATEKPSLVEENRRLHRLMVEGVDVEFYGEDGTIRGDKVRLIDFDDSDANDWLATGQFTVIDGTVNRWPDSVTLHPHNTNGPRKYPSAIRITAQTKRAVEKSTALRSPCLWPF